MWTSTTLPLLQVLPHQFAAPSGGSHSVELAVLHYRAEPAATSLPRFARSLLLAAPTSAPHEKRTEDKAARLETDVAEERAYLPHRLLGATETPPSSPISHSDAQPTHYIREIVHHRQACIRIVVRYVRYREGPPLLSAPCRHRQRWWRRPPQ